MNTGTVDGGNPAHEDRLPWLESAEEEHQEGPSMWRLVGLGLVVLALVAAAVFAFVRFQSQTVADGSGQLIAAAKGDYKVKPDEPGGMKVEGQGDTKFAASQGVTSNASIDVSKMPEAPVTGRTTTTPRASASGAAKVVAAVPERSGPLAPKAPASAPRANAQGATGGGSVVQLGSFPSEAGANAAWGQLSKRFGYLAALGKSVERAEVNGAATYRLRVNAGSAGNAETICGRLKVAGEGCFVPR
jgi:hypothetical protein